MSTFLPFRYKTFRTFPTDSCTNSSEYELSTKNKVRRIYRT